LMEPAANPVPAAAPAAPVWPEVTNWEYYQIVGIPFVTFIVFVIFFNMWPGYKLEKKPKVQHHRPVNESTPFLPKEEGRVFLAGEVRGTYDKDWKETFDYQLVIFMAATLAGLILATAVYIPSLFSNGTFWLYQAPKPFTMMGVSILCGMLCRKYCQRNDQGYIVTTGDSLFKVNYTRKVQHFMAYFIPLVIHTPPTCDCEGVIETAWGQWLTLLTFALTIKPLRERFDILMLQFNSMDRPEDRPDTLEWITLGNIIPGTIMILIFKWVIPPANAPLVMIIVFVTGLGDGLAEPVGIFFGKHPYRTSGFQNCIVYDKEGLKCQSMISQDQFSRSFEGSACVFLSGMIFTSMCYQYFDSAHQFWICFWLQGPLMSVAEAVSPHTVDTPFLMGLGGLSIWAIVTYF